MVKRRLEAAFEEAAESPARRKRCCRRAAAADAAEEEEAFAEVQAVGAAGANPLRPIAKQAAALRRGLAYIWLHFLYEPLYYRRRVLDAHRFLLWRKSSEATQAIEGAVLAAASDPFRARLPDSRCFLDPSPTLKRQSTMKTKQLLPCRRAALRIALDVRRTHLLSEESGAAAILPELPDYKHYFSRAPLEILRSAVFDSAVEPLLAATPAQLLAGVHVRFRSDEGVAEAGIDSGGLSREFFDLGLREIIAPGADHVDQLVRRRSFEHSSSSSSLPRPSRGSASRESVESVDGCGEPMFCEQADMALMLIQSTRPLAVYHALGRFLAVSLVHASYGDVALPSPLNDCLLKFMAGQPITAADVRRRDPVYYRNRIDMLFKPGGIEATAAALCLDSLVFAEDGVELMPDGASVIVTSENVKEYARLLSEEVVCGAVRAELAAVLAGFHEVVPEKLLKECGVTFSTLGMLFSGVAELDASSWRDHAEVRAAGVPKQTAAQVARWLWAILLEWPKEERSTLLAFSSGCSRLPAVGFAGLDPLFCVEVVPKSGQLPTAHTCFNCITIPAYASKEVLADKLALAIHESAGFGLR